MIPTKNTWQAGKTKTFTVCKLLFVPRTEAMISDLKVELFIILFKYVTPDVLQIPDTLPFLRMEEKD